MGIRRMPPLRAHASWWPRWLGGGVDIRNHVAQLASLGGSCADAPRNLHLMTNRMDENMEFDESELSDKALSVVAQTVRDSLVAASRKTGRKWILIVDTDGGTKHTLTQVAASRSQTLIPRDFTAATFSAYTGHRTGTALPPAYASYRRTPRTAITNRPDRLRLGKDGTEVHIAR